MKYQHQSFSVMPGTVEAYRDNYDRIFRGEPSGTATEVNTESEASGYRFHCSCGATRLEQVGPNLIHNCPGGLE